MVEELAILLDDFPGETNRTRCFTHILNLVAKSIIKRFDVPKTQTDDVLDDAAKELADLGVDLDIEERISRESQMGESDDEDDDDSLDTWIDVPDELSDEERRELDKSFLPVRLVLAKVSYQITQSMKFTYQFLFSFVKLPLRSKTHRLSFFLDGTPSLKNSSSIYALCHGMLLLAGTRRTICSNLLSIIR